MLNRMLSCRYVMTRCSSLWSLVPGAVLAAKL